MRFRLRRPMPERILALTYRYQKRYPGTWEGKPARGRIALEKRPKYNIKVAKLLVRDRTLRKLLLATGISKKEQCRRIIEYALRKANGNKQEAFAFLDAAIKRIERGTEIDLKLVREMANTQGLNQQQAETFVAHMGHMYVSATNCLTLPLIYCEGKIQEAISSQK